MMKVIWTYKLAIVYIICILAADILAARWIIPLPLGLAVPAGVFAIAPIFTLRDGVHENWGRRGAYILIAMASLLSWALAIVTGNGLLAKVTLASVAAFAINESVDTEIYAALRQKSKLFAMLGSNSVSALLDSVIFIGIAFGLVIPLIAGQYVVKMLIAGLIAMWWRIR